MDIKKELDNLNQTPMHLSCLYGSDRVFKLFMESEKIKLESLTSSSFDYLPLHHICRCKIEKPEFIETLLNRIIELKLNKMLRSRVNTNVRLKILKLIMPMIIRKFEDSLFSFEQHLDQKISY